MQWLSQLFSRRRRYDDVSVSIQEHLEARAEELMEQGMAPEEAERMARREFGNVSLMEERSREVWQWQKLESVAADLKLVLRRLRKSPVFAAIVLMTLAVGIGANTAIFTVLDHVILQPLPYPDSGRLVSLNLNAPGAEGLTSFTNGLRISPSMYFTFTEHNRTLQSLGVWIRHTANVTGIAQPEEVHTVQISDGVLQTLSVQPALGRWFSPADQDPRGAMTVILSYGYWQRRFGGDRSVIGRNINLDSEPREIVGVMPRGFQLIDQEFDILAPLAFDRSQLQLPPFGFQGIARLKPGVSIAEADADIARMLPIWMDSWSNGPGTDSHFYETWKIAPALRPLKQEVIGSVANVLWVVMATIGLVMLIACSNVANLLLVRVDGRQQELALRAALGAGRGRIVRELLLESVSLGLIGGVLGVGVAFAGLKLLIAIGPSNLPRLAEVALDANSLVFTLLLSLVSGLFFGAIPAWKYVRAGVRTESLGSTRTMSAGRERHRSRNLLVVAQVAMAVVLLVSALLMVRTFQALRHVDPGFADAGHLQTLRISIPESLVPVPQTAERIQNSIAENLAAIPGVSAVGFAAAMPMEGAGPDWNEIEVEGRVYGEAGPPLRLFNNVSPGYFHAAGTRMIAGRDYTWSEIYGFRDIVIVSENFARETWGSPSQAIGKRLRGYPGMPWKEVIGVVQDVHHNGVNEQPPVMIYWPAMMKYKYYPQGIDLPRAVTFAIRTSRAGSESLLNQLQQAVWSVNADIPVASVRTMEEIYSDSLSRISFTLVMLAIAGGMALLLGMIGIYGVISYTVSQRTREIGIRLALGARKNELKWMFVRASLFVTGIGLALGLGLAAGLMRLMKSILFGISPLDPLTYTVALGALMLAAVFASYLPARRASAVDPMEALRTE